LNEQEKKSKDAEKEELKKKIAEEVLGE